MKNPNNFHLLSWRVFSMYTLLFSGMSCFSLHARLSLKVALKSEVGFLANWVSLCNLQTRDQALSAETKLKGPMFYPFSHHYFQP